MAYTAEFIGLNLDFASKVTNITGLPPETVIAKYTCIPRTILKVNPAEGSDGTVWKDFLESLDYDPIKKTLELQEKSEKHETERRLRSGRISATLPNNEGLALLHFSEDHNETNPFGIEGQKLRRKEIREVLLQLEQYKPLVIGMFSWLLDTRFINFFPQDCEVADNPNAFFASLAVWGQFLTFDGKLNEARSSQFSKRYKAATNTSELLGSFPYRALQIRTPYTDMKKMY